MGSAPAKIDPDQGFALYQPNGELCELDRSVGEGYYFGDFEAPMAGEYRFVLDELQDVQSRGALIAKDALPFRGPTGWLAILCLVLSGPVAFVGGLLWIASPKESPPRLPQSPSDPEDETPKPPAISAKEDVMRRFEGRK